MKAGVYGVEALKRKFAKMNKAAEDMPNVLKEETYHCYLIAFANAPFLFGRLRNAIITQLKFPSEGWIISTTPPHAMGFPYHALIETAQYAETFPKYVIQEQGAGRIMFMQQTTEEFEPGFIKRINGKIEYSII